MQLSPCQLQMGACAFCGPSFPSPRPALGSRAAADDVQSIGCPRNVDVGCDCRSHCDHKLCFSSPCHSCPRRATACQRKCGHKSAFCLAFAAKTVFFSRAARDLEDALHGLPTSSGGAAVRGSSAADHRIFAAVCSATATRVQRRNACVRQSGPRLPLSGALCEKLSGRGGRARAVASSKD